MTQELPAGFPGAFKNYRVVRLIGQGGMGAVVEGADNRDGTRVAIKVLHPHLAAADASFLERFEREAHVAALLRSPYTVHILDFGQQDGRTFLVMEYIDGESLSDLINRGPVEPDRALKITSEVARALEEAEARGIVHRDIKPDNILLDSSGRVKVTDFGIARPMNTAGMTQAGSFVGTPAFAAPEQVEGRVDHRADIYSVGATLFAMLAGRPPYRGATPMDTMLMQRTAPIPMGELMHLPDAATNVVRRCLEKDPLDRYQTAAELAGAADRARQNLSRGGGPSPATGAMAPRPASTAPPSAASAQTAAFGATAAAPAAMASTSDPTVAAPPPQRPAARSDGGAAPPMPPPEPKDGAGAARKRRMLLLYAGGAVAAIAAAVGIAIALSGGDGDGDGPSPAATATTTVVAGNAADYTIAAAEFFFDKPTLAAPPNTDVSFTLENNGRVRHSLQFLDKKGGRELAPGASGSVAEAGTKNQVSFKTPARGTYYFECSVYPDRMNGAFEVRDDAPQPPGGAGGQPGGGSAVQQEVTATDFAFDKKELEAAPNTAVKFTMKNAGQAPHSLVFLDARGGKELASGSTGTTTNGGQSSTVSFTTPGAGTYFFQCGIHPGQMNGTFTVKAAGGAQPTSAATSTTAAPAAVTLDVVATEFQFDKKELRVQAGAKVTVNLKHGGAAVPRHSIQFLDAKGGKELAPGSTGKVINSGQTDTLTFTAPAAGTYHYECAIHPGQMTGVLTVTGAAAGATSVPTLESVRTAVAQNSRLVSGSKAQVVTAVSVFAEPSGTARIVTALSVGTRVTVVTGTPAGSTFVITEGLIWFRVLVDGTQTVGWVPEVRTDNSIRYLERVP